VGLEQFVDLAAEFPFYISVELVDAGVGVNCSRIRWRGRVGHFPHQWRAHRRIAIDQGVQQAGAAAGQTEDKHRLFDDHILDFRVALAVIGDSLEAAQVVVNVAQIARPAIVIEALIFIVGLEQGHQTLANILAEIVVQGVLGKQFVGRREP